MTEKTSPYREGDSERCERRYQVPQTSPPRDEPFDVTYRCAQSKNHDGPHGDGSANSSDKYVEHVHCSRCGKRCSGVDPELGLVVRAYVQCPECLTKDEHAFNAMSAEIAQLREACYESNAVCMCGCPLEEHESYGDEGEACQNGTHECLRTSKAVYAVLARLTREQQEAMTVLAPNMPASGLVDACKQLRQAYISERDNADYAEAENARLTRELRVAREALDRDRK